MPLDPDGNPTFNSLGLQILTHWKEHRPRMYVRLEQEGRLREAVLRAQELTTEAFTAELQSGIPPHIAWESVRERFAFLPEEAPEENTLEG